MCWRRSITFSSTRSATLVANSSIVWALPGSGVIRSCERVDLAALVDGRLADHVRRRTEPVQAQPVSIAGQLERPVADEPATQEGGDLLVVEFIGQVEAVALVRDREFGVSAIHVAAREARVQAEVLAVRGAVLAGPVGPAEPGHAHSSPVLGAADDLVPEYDRKLGRLDLVIAQVKVGAADRAGTDLEQQLPGLWFRLRERRRLERLALAFEDYGAHLVSFGAPGFWLRDGVEPGAAGGVERGCDPMVQLLADLAERSEPLGHHVVLMDRLEVHLRASTNAASSSWGKASTAPRIISRTQSSTNRGRR